MDGAQIKERDQRMMLRAIALSKESGKAGEYPYGVLICHGDKVVAETVNRVKQDADVTRHAEVVAISAAQRALGSTSLHECVIYGSAEPCVFCSYAIRESRIGRVVYGLHSPHFGGLSKWNVLEDKDISRAAPEVFSSPPEVVAGYMAREAAAALHEWNPLVWTVMNRRGLFTTDAPDPVRARKPHLPRHERRELLLNLIRRNLFDHFGRR